MYRVPTTTRAMPIGVIEKMPRLSAPARCSRSFASRKAGALTRVRVVPSDAASDIGISRREAGSWRSRACRSSSGSIIAVTITWWVKAASSATSGITTAIVRASPRPPARLTQVPRRSLIPVAASAPEITKTAATMIAGSLAKPDRACLLSSTPVSTSASRISIAVMSTRSFSLMNRYSPPTRINPNDACWNRCGGNSMPPFCLFACGTPPPRFAHCVYAGRRYPAPTRTTPMPSLPTTSRDTPRCRLARLAGACPGARGGSPGSHAA